MIRVGIFPFLICFSGNGNLRWGTDQRYGEGMEAYSLNQVS
ncbi:hypothetical protein SAMN05660816_05457 [Niastella yeongjuensis]|nr:hypothetical protein SAMN05660816_05457 [Niastella yeongjuensis]